LRSSGSANSIPCENEAREVGIPDLGVIPSYGEDPVLGRPGIDGINGDA
jgi:hypothetical protein